MKSSNISRKPIRFRLISPCAAALAILCLAGTALALDPGRSISQYVRDDWGANRGFIGGAVHAISQSDDGYLWIGTERGLVRFDGFNFTLIQRPIPDSPPIGSVHDLIYDAEGSLWIRLAGPRMLRYRNGLFEEVYSRFDLQDITFTAAAATRDDGVLFSGLGERTFRYRNGQFQTVVSADNNPGTVISLAETLDRRVWLGTNDDGLFRVSNGHIAKIPGAALDTAEITALVPANNGGLWIGTDRGVQFWDGSQLLRPGLPPVIQQLKILTMLKDHDANIWLGTERGLIRIAPSNVVSLEQLSPNPGSEVTTLFEDRDGDIWFGGSRGISRLRNGMFATYSVADGFPSESNGPVFADSEGRTWFAPLSGGLYWFRDGQVHPVTLDGLARDVVYSIDGGQGEVWVGRQHGGLTRLTGDGDRLTARTYTQTDGLAQNSVYSVHRDRDGSVWAGTVSAGVSRLANGKFTSFSEADGLPSNMVNALTEGYDGTVWVATPTGLASFAHGHWNTRSRRDGLPSSNVKTVFEDGEHVLWIATTAGLAFLSAGRIDAPRRLPDALREQIFGMAEDQMGWLWFATSDHVLRVNRDRLLKDALEDTDVQSYGISDGLLGLEGVGRDRTMVADGRGRIWVSLDQGISVADPRVTAINAIPVAVRMESISAGGNPVNTRNPAPIPAGIESIVFQFAGSNLAVPDRVRFRYRLDGPNPDPNADLGSHRVWSDIVATRQVSYRNLGPGSYRFVIVASNSEGLWNGPETVVPFLIEPAFWQTWWFRAIALVALGLGVFGAFRLRMYQLTQQLDMRFQERLAERSRIAQDLHDTLLQGVLSASLQLDVAEDQLPKDSPARPQLQRVLQLMARVIEEGRNALRGLRSTETESRSLELAFSRMRQEFALEERIGYRVIVDSTTRPLRPLIRDEVYRIGREALVNAFVHAHATSIEVQLDYASRHLKVTVRDDGLGIDPQVLHAGREGHWGLPGMRERSESIGASLKLRSRLGAGTEVELTVPSTIAFEDESQRPFARWLPWLRKENGNSGATDTKK